MNFEQFTDRARGFVQSAQSLALREGHQQFSPDHLLKVLLDDNEGLAAGLIRKAGGDPKAALERPSRRRSPSDPKVSGGGSGQLYMASELARVFDSAEKIAEKAGDKYVTAERLLLALALEKGTDAAKILADAGVTPQGLNTAINEIRKGRTADTASAEQGYDALKRYARDLTEAAAAGKLDPVIGRDEEIRRTIQVLSRRTKNNPVLIGEPGVGKTAIAEGPGAAHRAGRRARQPQGQEAAVARHGRAHRRREVSRRVRGASEGRAQRGAGRGRPHHPVHRRAAHHRRRRQDRRLDGCRQPVEAGACPRRAALHRRDDAR